MNTPKLVVTIPEPCHEDWNKMKPVDNGRYCSSCNKSVIDFTDKTDDQIKDYLLLNKGEKVCGQFKKTQVNRPLIISVDLKSIPKNISITKVFTICIVLTFGTMLFSCIDYQGKKIEGIEVHRQSGYQYNTLGAPTPPPDEIVCLDTASKKQVSPPDTLNADESLTKEIANRPLQDSLKPWEVEFCEPVIKGGYAFTEELIAGDIMIGDTLLQSSAEIPADSAAHEMNRLGGLVLITEAMSCSEDLTKTEAPLKPGTNLMQPEIVRTFGIFPNPGQSDFTIQYELIKRSDVRIDIINSSGIVLKTPVNMTAQHHGNYQIPLSLNECPPGVYFAVMLCEGKKTSKKFVINR